MRFMVGWQMYASGIIRPTTPTYTSFALVSAVNDVLMALTCIASPQPCVEAGLHREKMGERGTRRWC